MSSLGAGHSGTFKIGDTTINRIGYGKGRDAQKLFDLI